MRVGVIGSRTFKDYEFLKAKLAELDITSIISGGANGADSLSEKYAKEFSIPVVVHKANWKDMTEPCVIKRNAYGEYNALAGFNRNTTIVEDSDIIVAFWDGESKGTLDSLNKAKQLGKKVIVPSF